MDPSSPDSQNPYASPAAAADAEPASVSRNKPNEPLVEPIRTSGALSLADYHYGVRLGKRWLRRLDWAVFLLMPLGVVIWGFSGELKQGHLGTAVALYFILLFLIWLLETTLHWLRNWRVRKIQAAGKGIFAHVEAAMYEDHYEVLQEQMAAKVMWSMFRKFRHSDRAVVLYYDANPFQFAILPRSKFKTQHDWECFIGLLDRKMPRC